MTLAEFLLARIAEDEEVAFGACLAPVRPDDWRLVEHSVYQRPTIERAPHLRDQSRIVATVLWGPAQHVVRHDPARVLAECEAKRQIVKMHSGAPCCETCYDATNPYLSDRLILDPCPTLRALALPYAGHPDYRQEWRP